MPPKPPRALPKAEKDKEGFFFFKELLKQTHTQYTEPAPCRKPPQESLTQRKENERERKKEKEKKKEKKEKIIIKKDSTHKKMFHLWPNGAFLPAMSCQTGTTTRANQP